MINILNPLNWQEIKDNVRVSMCISILWPTYEMIEWITNKQQRMKDKRGENIQINIKRTRIKKKKERKSIKQDSRCIKYHIEERLT